MYSFCLRSLFCAGLGDRKQPDLALKCIDQLMITTNYNFTRYGVDISDTLMHCLGLAQTPIHPVRSLPLQGLDSYIVCVVHTTTYYN